MKHHPSCKPSDVSLVWKCRQCGEIEDAELYKQAAEKVVESAKALLHEISFPSEAYTEPGFFLRELEVALEALEKEMKL